MSKVPSKLPIIFYIFVKPLSKLIQLSLLYMVTSYKGLFPHSWILTFHHSGLLYHLELNRFAHTFYCYSNLLKVRNYIWQNRDVTGHDGQFDLLHFLSSLGNQLGCIISMIIKVLAIFCRLSQSYIAEVAKICIFNAKGKNMLHLHILWEYNAL